MEEGTRNEEHEKGAEREEDLDAMGQDKRRKIIGQGYGPGKARQFIYYGLVIALIVGLYVGATFAISELDVAPKEDKDQAPWSKSVQVPPQQFE